MAILSTSNYVSPDHPRALLPTDSSFGDTVRKIEQLPGPFPFLQTGPAELPNAYCVHLIHRVRWDYMSRLGTQTPEQMENLPSSSTALQPDFVNSSPFCEDVLESPLKVLAFLATKMINSPSTPIESSTSTADGSLAKKSEKKRGRDSSAPIRALKTCRLDKQKECDLCHTQTTSQWRAGPAGTVLCNSHGVVYLKIRRSRKQEIATKTGVEKKALENEMLEKLSEIVEAKAKRALAKQRDFASRVCGVCATTKTSEWRKGPKGMILCNKDGILFLKVCRAINRTTATEDEQKKLEEERSQAFFKRIKRRDSLKKTGEVPESVIKERLQPLRNPNEKEEI